MIFSLSNVFLAFNYNKNFQLIFPFVSILIISKIKIIAQLILLGWKKLVLKLIFLKSNG